MKKTIILACSILILIVVAACSKGSKNIGDAPSIVGKWGGSANGYTLSIEIKKYVAGSADDLFIITVKNPDGGVENGSTNTYDYNSTTKTLKADIGDGCPITIQWNGKQYICSIDYGEHGIATVPLTAK